jgi:hypothetical protein
VASATKSPSTAWIVPKLDPPAEYAPPSVPPAPRCQRGGSYRRGRTPARGILATGTPGGGKSLLPVLAADVAALDVHLAEFRLYRTLLVVDEVHHLPALADIAAQSTMTRPRKEGRLRRGCQTLTLPNSRVHCLLPVDTATRSISYSNYWREHGRDGFLLCRHRLVADRTGDLAVSADAATSAPAKPTLRNVQRIVRDTALGHEVKRPHDRRFQVCGVKLDCASGPYAEAAHISPLGRPHDGPNDLANLLCLLSQPSCSFRQWRLRYRSSDGPHRHT